MALLSRNTSVVLVTAGALVASLAMLSPAQSVEPPTTQPLYSPEPVGWVHLQLPTLAAPAPTIAAPETTIAAPEPAAAPAEPGPDWSIAIDTSGWQNELDLCLWVRMDFDGVVPMVGAHNYCGGDFILTLGAGQTVQLGGYGLDGRYLVTDARDVFSGDDAIAATSGLVADVILQTCYWDEAIGMRLVALTRLN